MRCSCFETSSCYAGTGPASRRSLVNFPGAFENPVHAERRDDQILGPSLLVLLSPPRLPVQKVQKEHQQTRRRHPHAIENHRISHDCFSPFPRMTIASAMITNQNTIPPSATPSENLRSLRN